MHTVYKTSTGEQTLNEKKRIKTARRVSLLVRNHRYARWVPGTGYYYEYS